MIRTILIHFISITVFMFKLQVYGCPDVPKTCERGMISFHLYTRPHIKPYELVLDDTNTIKNAPFRPDTNFKFIVHGYTGNRTHPNVLEDLRNEYFKQQPWNILVVDWGPLAKEGCYFSSAFHSISLVGGCCANLLKNIFDNNDKIKPGNVHVIGFSMGAQVAALLGKHIRPIVLPRITGLDPAFPLFTEGISKKDEILNREHAEFVDTYHTCMGLDGVYFSNAHYDIYANKGVFQPGCGVTDVSCSHQRAVRLFTESINSKTKFIAHKCDHHWVYITFKKCDGSHKIRIEVGEHIKPPPSEKETGTYQLPTNDKPPFAVGDNP